MIDQEALDRIFIMTRYVCRVHDSKKNNQMVANCHCDAETEAIAKAHFEKEPRLSNYWGQPQYTIRMRSSPVTLQYSRKESKEV